MYIMIYPVFKMCTC